MSDLLVCDQPTIVLGDLNYLVIDWMHLKKPLPSSSVYFVDMVRSQPWAVSKRLTRRGHILKILLTNYSSLVENVSIEPLKLATTTVFLVQFAEHRYTYYRHFGMCDYEEICDYSSSVAWRQSLDSVSTMNEKNLFLSVIGDAIEKFVPSCRTKPMYAYVPAYFQKIIEHVSSGSLQWHRQNTTEKSPMNFWQSS